MMNSIKLLAVFFFIPLVQAFTPAPAKVFRVMSYNVRNAMGMDRKIDYERVAATIRSNEPDIVAVQELDSMTNRSGKKYVLKEIAGRAGYHYVYAAAIDYDGGKYGIGILSKEKPLRFWNLPLPGREEKRTLQIAEFKNFVFANVHLSLTEEDRVSSVVIINEELKKINKPVFLAGDFNATPASGAIQSLLKNNWQLLSGETFTFPANEPNTCIDYIFKLGGENQKVSKAAVIADSMASDHRPVLVEMKR